MAKDNDAMRSFQAKMADEARADFVHGVIQKALDEAGLVVDKKKQKEMEALLFEKIDQAAGEIIARFIR